MVKDTPNYFSIKNPKYARFSLLPKNHEPMHDVPGRPVVLNCDYYTENISLFLDYHLKPLAQKVKSYKNQILKDTNHFLNKAEKLGELTQWAILCTVDVVGLYPNIPHSKGLTSLQRFSKLRNNT